MNSDGSGVRNVTSHAARDDHPAWHPDGRLVFVSDRDGGADLYLDVVPLHRQLDREIPTGESNP